MPANHIAHFNWAMLQAAPDDARVKPFFDGVGRVNAIAERAPGFIWRNGQEDTDARSIGWDLFESDRTIASFSVWDSPDALWHFVHKTLHGAFLRRGDEWFEKAVSYNYALWWVPAAHIPDISEARARVTQLLRDGPGEEVFTFRDLPAVVGA